MIDLSIAFLAFFLTFHLSAVLLQFALRFRRFSTFFSGGRGLYLAMGPLFMGMIVAVVSVIPHWLGSLNGAGHISDDLHNSRGETIPVWLLALISVVGVRFLLRILAEAQISTHLRRECSKVTPQLQAKVSEALEPLRNSNLPTPKICFHSSDRFYEPFLRGFFRPVIYLHVDLVETLTIKHLRAALFHELGHQKRGDHLVMTLYSLFLNAIGLGRLIQRGYDEWVEASEQTCDVIASRFVESSRTVAEALVAVLKFSSKRHAPEGCPALCGHRSIKQRVAKLIATDKEIDLDPIESSQLLHGGSFLFGSSMFFSFVAPRYGLELYCLFEQLVGTHCVG